MAAQLLRNCRVVLVHETLSYPLEAISDISLSTTYGLATGKRKTLFKNTNSQYSIESKINPTTINMSVVLTTSATEKIFFELIGLTKQVGGRYDFPDAPASVSPKLFELNFINQDESLKASPCFIESIDISFTKSDALRLDIAVSAAKVAPVPQPDTVGDPNCSPFRASPVNLVLGTEAQSRIRSGSVSIQQIASWVDDKSLFSAGFSGIYTHSKAFVSDMIISANAFLTYNPNLDNYNKAVYRNFQIGKTGLKVFFGNARIVRNLEFGSVYQARLDISYTEESSDTYLIIGDI